MNKLGLAAMEMVREVISVPNLSGKIETNGTVSVSGLLADNAAATKLKEKLDGFDKAMMVVIKGAEELIKDDKEGIKPIVTKLTERKGLFLATVKDKLVSAQCKVETLMAFPSLLIIEQQQRRAERMKRVRLNKPAEAW